MIRGRGLLRKQRIEGRDVAAAYRARGSPPAAWDSGSRARPVLNAGDGTIDFERHFIADVGEVSQMEGKYDSIMLVAIIFTSTETAPQECSRKRRKNVAQGGSEMYCSAPAGL